MALPVREMTFAEAIDFTRASSAWYFDSSGDFVEATTDNERLDHDPATGNRLGLMAEGASTNLLTYSEDLSNAAWTKTHVTIGTPTTFAGAISLDEVVETGINSYHAVHQQVTVSSSGLSTVSCHLKRVPGSRRYAYVRALAFNATGTVGRYSVLVDLDDGSVLDTDKSGSTGVTNAARHRVVDMGDGVYRVEVSVTAFTEDTPEMRVDAGLSNTATPVWDQFSTIDYVGNSSESLYAGGFQVEGLSGASSYIPTAGSSVTRAAEVVQVQSLDPWYRASGYSVAVQAITRIAANQFLFMLDDGTTDDRAGFFLSNSSNESRLIVTDGGAPTDAIDAGAFPDVLSEFKLAGRFAEADCSVSLDGAAAVDDGTVTLPAAATTARLGSGSAGTSLFYGWIQDLKYTTTLWSDAELATESGTTV